MSSYHIHIEGQIQGVGFRPYVFRLANKLALKGWVSNGTDGVNIEIEGEESPCKLFLDQLSKDPPPLARITYSEVIRIKDKGLVEFIIEKSNKQSKANVLITPDLGMCEDCRKELNDPSSRRYQYPFTTCTKCGPRFSLIRSLPYDRESTTMSDFEMCPRCWAEYNNPVDRRFYSQTNSCPICGVTISLIDSEKKLITQNISEILEEVKSLIKEGSIMAVKGIGGYLLITDATNTLAVKKLRERKQRSSKPFALLYPSIEMVMRDAVVSPAEKKELLSIESPIVLLKTKSEMQIDLAIEQVAPQLDQIGVMLPYSPLLQLISESCGKPLIATSGNISGSPIFFEDESAIANLNSIADYFLINDRDIVIPQDDSVVHFVNEQRLVLRRSRGYAPTYIPHPFQSEKTVLATGGELKSTFSLLHENNLYVSQYLGDLANFDTQENYQHVVNHFLKLFECKPTKVLIDSHPNYYSSQLGRELAKHFNASLNEVPHHLAHFSAVLAENDLINSEEKILGVIWDGTGWGEDGNIWGGEFFSYQQYNFERTSHLEYFDHILGDKFSLEPRLSALSICQDIEDAKKILKPKFSQSEWQLYNSILKQSNNLQTSSMGRLFDAVASLLGLCDKSSYEGEAAMYLESGARKAVTSFTSENEIVTPFNFNDVIKKLVVEINQGISKEILAYKFHVTLVKWIEQEAVRENASKIAFSGGVFQNALLIELLQKHLADKYQLYFHQQLSPNDECISFGQLAFEEIKQRKNSVRVLETENLIEENY